MKSIASVVLALSSLVLLSACPDTGIVCSTGTVRCGSGCVDPAADTKNCGACGTACRLGQMCSKGACVCGSGSRVCGGECVVTETDPGNCGSCGNKCSNIQVCQESSAGAGGSCAIACPLTGASTRCGASCVNASTNPLNCGACGVACENQQTCRAGRCTYDLVVACLSSGQLVGVQAADELRGTLEPLGTTPQSLAAVGGVLLCLDGTDQKLYQARIASVAGHPFQQLPAARKTGVQPNQVVVDLPWVYVANSGSNTIQFLVTDGGMTADGGLELDTVWEVFVGSNTVPEGMVRVGDILWVPLLDLDADAGRGGKVVGLDLSDLTKTKPTLARWLDLSTLDLRSFDGGRSRPHPDAILAHRGSLYVTLNNLDSASKVAGPGMLAKINPATSGLSSINLGADKCLNPRWLGSDGTHLLVACHGATEYAQSGAASRPSVGAGVVLLDENDVVQSRWEPRCNVGLDGGPPGPDGGNPCPPILPGRFAVRGGRVYVGDQNGGRLYVLDIIGNGLGERRGPFSNQPELLICPPDPVTGVANVGDVFSVP